MKDSSDTYVQVHVMPMKHTEKLTDDTDCLCGEIGKYMTCIRLCDHNKKMRRSAKEGQVKSS